MSAQLMMLGAEPEDTLVAMSTNTSFNKAIRQGRELNRLLSKQLSRWSCSTCSSLQLVTSIRDRKST